MRVQQSNWFGTAVVAVCLVIAGCSDDPDSGDGGIVTPGTGGSGGTGASGGGSGTDTGGSAGSGGGTETGGAPGTGGSGGASGSDGGSGTGGSATAGSGGTGGSWGTPGASCPGSTDDCSSASLPGGTFPLGRSDSGTDACPGGMTCLDLPGYETPEHDATISPFDLDTYEVTVARFRVFLAAYDGSPPPAGAGAHPLVADSGWDSTWDSNLPPSQADLEAALACNANATWTAQPGAHEALPINCVSWYEAFYFCAWDGGRLPTEAEWEFAAAGGDENRLYPWGSDAPDATRATYNVAAPAAVGSAPAGEARWGHLDLAGNVWEWTRDRFLSQWYTEPAAGGIPCNDCANLDAGVDRLMRGGSFAFQEDALRAVTRVPQPEMDRLAAIGFRCAR